MNKTAIKYLQIVYWLASVGFLFFFLVFEIPHKGINLSDEGIYFTASSDYLHGVFNSYGLAGLINAVLLWFHAGYLQLSQFFYLIQYVAGLVFFLSLRLNLKYSWLAPMAITLMLASAPVHVLSYETAGPIMLLLGLAFLFFSLNYQLSSILKNISYALSAVFFCYSALANLILVPFLLANFIVLFFIYPKIRNYTFWIVYILISVIGLYFIIFKTLPLFELASYYNPNFIQITLKELCEYSLMILGFILAGFITTSFFAWSGKLIIKNKILSANLAFIAATLILWIGIRHYFHGGYLSWSNTLLLYSFVFLGVIFATYGIKPNKGRVFNLLALALVLNTFYFLAMAAATQLPWYTRSMAHASEICLIVLLWLEYLFSQENSFNWKKCMIAIIIILSGSHYALKAQMNYAFGEITALQTQKITDIKRLDGVYVYPAFLISLKKIIAVYNENDCKNKLFIERSRSPGFYFIFDRNGRPPFFYSTFNRDLKELKQANKTNGFCYMADEFFEGNMNNHSHSKAIQDFHKLHQWLEHHSKKIVEIPINNDRDAKGIYVKLYMS